MKKLVKIQRKNGTTFYQNREVSEENSELKEHFKRLVKITSGKQKEFFSWQLKKTKVCKISTTPNDIKVGHPQLKQCYQNSFDVVMLNKDVKYCEGFVSFMGIPIEHAWNKIGDEYFDVTADGPLKDRQGKFDEYLSVIELSKEELKDLGKKPDYQSYISKQFLKEQR